MDGLSPYVKAPACMIPKQAWSLCSEKIYVRGHILNTSVGHSQEDAMGPQVPFTCQGQPEGLSISKATGSEEGETTIKRKKTTFRSSVNS